MVVCVVCVCVNATPHLRIHFSWIEVVERIVEVYIYILNL